MTVEGGGQPGPRGEKVGKEGNRWPCMLGPTELFRGTCLGISSAAARGPDCSDLNAAPQTCKTRECAFMPLALPLFSREFLLCDPRLPALLSCSFSSLLEELLISTQKSVCEYKTKSKKIACTYVNVNILTSKVQYYRHYKAERDRAMIPIPDFKKRTE